MWFYFADIKHKQEILEIFLFFLNKKDINEQIFKMFCLVFQDLKLNTTSQELDVDVDCLVPISTFLYNPNGMTMCGQ